MTVLTNEPFDNIINYDDSPYCMIGDAGSGKTTALIDIISKIKYKFDETYYVSEKNENLPESVIQISDSFQSMYELWTHLKSNCYTINKNENIILSVKQLIEMIMYIYPKSKYEEVINNYNILIKSVNENEKDIISIQLLKEAIIDGINKYGYDNYKNIDKIVRLKHRLLVLDISKMIKCNENSNCKVFYDNVYMPIEKATKLLLENIFSKARRYGITVIASVNPKQTAYGHKNFILTSSQDINRFDFPHGVYDKICEHINKIYDNNIMIIKDSNIYLTKYESYAYIEEKEYNNFVSKLIYVPK